jgi:DNA-binding response OmpR family regulator
MRILLVEDSVADVELTLEALEDAKIANEVTVVRDGAAALTHLRTTATGPARPDLVILDLNLPRMSGHEVLAAMRADDDLRRMPVAILTTSSAEADVVRTYDLGANCYLTKPVDVDQFVHVVRSIEDFWLGLVRLPRRVTCAVAAPGALDRHSPLSLLLIEDSAADSALFQDLLEDELPRTTVTTCRTLADAPCARGDRALRRGDGGPRAAGRHGLSVVEAVRDADRSPALLVLTGRDDSSLALTALSFGAQDYLVKGRHDGGALATAVLHAVQRQRASALTTSTCRWAEDCSTPSRRRRARSTGPGRSSRSTGPGAASPRPAGTTRTARPRAATTWRPATALRAAPVTAPSPHRSRRGCATCWPAGRCASRPSTPATARRSRPGSRCGSRPPRSTAAPAPSSRTWT